METPQELNMMCGKSNELNGEKNCFGSTTEKKMFAFDKV